MVELEFQQKTKTLIDSLKSICANYGLGNDGNEFKIITQTFLYKFLNDKFAFEAKKLDDNISKADKWEEALAAMGEDDLDMLQLQMGGDTARLKPQHFISYLFSQQNAPDFAKLFDDTLIDIAITNNDVFAVKTDGGAKVVLFDRVSQYIADDSKRDAFCRAIINKLVEFSFERIFTQKFDFYATIFEYLIKDYNSNSGGKYAEYFTPHAVARIMAEILVPKEQRGIVRNVACYDPSAGSGTLLMNVAHAIGENRCSIYTQDISQKSSNLLRLNLILNNLVHSIPNVIQGNTVQHPYHKDGKELKRFDYIVSNPPFKLDFSDFRDELDSKENKERFFAGIPKIKAKAKDKMEIYQLFLQHIIASLKPGGKAAVVVPTGFITAQSGIDKKIREHLVKNKMLAGVVSMPSNIFATTGTNVSILFIDASNDGDVVLVDASNLGEKVKDGKNQKTVLTPAEEQQIIDVFNAKETVEDFSVAVSYSDIEAKNYSLSAGQYFDVKIEYVDITPEQFAEKMQVFTSNLDSLFNQSRELGAEIKKQLAGLKYE
ncbi:MAG: class I SAM-dependent DNA methyltransferase [Alteromonas macleodii]|jgi:type I restriction enzyme M protein|uniref:site-specific DNA-methyltransferase (adenine-specific) n=1 Tax=Alteromonas portus TaxID=2565549 RepID=A0A4U0ZDZ1_9ALTE|nr:MULTISPECIES: class I SAM-dependent DNA methyltransferase [Alteromonas]MCP4279994.1 SAM-dependent DNA methyltransferase [Alteromonas sp.]MDM7962780.1 class I SAM-dependent DNA methyltransferase [Alteromonas macleodii]MDM8168985.1 class I SAM-dependent DNA methyltransferase [Alteromonas macleodii]TKB02558.1 SAM-dependent DNA methyltransferase [Alteromonas portus]CAI3923084.1 type I restriction enzyme M protein [Alteromonas macleodii]|tara:strand:+ start:428 stop:2062 length:1635 start_codon:yes stop_codon:yes gene_type:complete